MSEPIITSDSAGNIVQTHYLDGGYDLRQYDANNRLVGYFDSNGWGYRLKRNRQGDITHFIYDDGRVYEFVKELGAC